MESGLLKVLWQVGCKAVNRNQLLCAGLCARYSPNGPASGKLGFWDTWEKMSCINSRTSCVSLAMFKWQEIKTPYNRKDSIRPLGCIVSTQWLAEANSGRTKKFSLGILLAWKKQAL